MRRPLLALALLLVGLVVADRFLQRRQEDQRVQQATLRPLLSPARQIVPERVRRVVLRRSDGEFTYVRDGGLWRFPAYHNAIAHTDRLERLLRLSLLSYGTLVSTDPATADALGLRRPPLQLGFFDSRGEGLLDLQVAGGLAGPGGVESFVRIAGSDSLLRLHADPGTVIGGGQPPMIDPHLLPRAVPRSTPVDIEARRGGERVWRLQRVLAPRPEGVPPMPRTDDQRYRWLLHRAGRVDTCRTGSVTAYLRYLQRLQVRALSSDSTGVLRSRLRVTDEEGRRDDLVALQPSAAGGDALLPVHNVRAGIVALLPPVQVEALTPPAAVFIDSLVRPDLFDRALQSPDRESEP